MDPFTQRMLERARARQEKIDQKLASSGQTPLKRKPLTENLEIIKTESAVKSPSKTCKNTIVSPRKSSMKSDSPLKSSNRSSIKTESPVKTATRRPSLKKEQSIVASPQKGRNDVVVTKTEFKTSGGSGSRRNSDVSLEINIMHSKDIHVDVQIEESDAPMSVIYDSNVTCSNVIIKEIEGEFFIQFVMLNQHQLNGLIDKTLTSPAIATTYCYCSVNLYFTEDLPEVSIGEIEIALGQLKNGKAPGEDGVTTKLLKAEGRTPEAWSRSVVVLFFKKGDKTLLKNYRPISLLSHVYKLFSRVIANRLARRFDDFQPPEQAGFRSGYGTIDHIHTVRQIIQKTEEYNQPLCLAFVDYEKAFDSIEIWSVQESLQRCQVDWRYIQVIRCLYEAATMSVQVQNQQTSPIPLHRGVRQGDVISNCSLMQWRICSRR
ncbi:hypothetical protein evm_000483 [Chilo suppressalis]|nr:hypothetical protein evm_000483 [Chilo suppressalis]